MLFNITAVDDTSVSACLFSLDGGTNNQSLEKSESIQIENSLDSDTSFGGYFTMDDGVDQLSQEINATSDLTFSSVSLFVKWGGSTTINFTIGLQSESGGEPSGTYLCLSENTTSFF